MSETKRSLIPEPKAGDRMEELRRISAEAEAGGGAKRREREHKAGKLAAREKKLAAQKSTQKPVK